MKYCSSCGNLLPLEDFSPNKTGVMGRKASCRACCNERRRALRIAHRIGLLEKKTPCVVEPVVLEDPELIPNKAYLLIPLLAKKDGSVRLAPTHNEDCRTPEKRVIFMQKVNGAGRPFYVCRQAVAGYVETFTPEQLRDYDIIDD